MLPQRMVDGQCPRGRPRATPGDPSARTGCETLAAGEQRRARGGRRAGRARLGSTVFFGVLAVALLAAAAYLYFQEEEGGTETPRRPATPGQLELINVDEALRAEGLDATIVAGRESVVTADAIGQPGQALTVEGDPLWVFAFPDVARREEVSEGLDPASVVIANGRGAVATAIANAPRLLTHGNLIIAVPADTPDDRIETIERALASLP